MENKENWAGREIIIEYQSFGSVVKVTAMDTASLKEVTIQGPASAGEAALKQTVLKKLDYVLKKDGILKGES